MDRDMAERLAPLIMSLWAGGDLDEMVDANSALNDWPEDAEGWIEEHRGLLYAAADQMQGVVVNWLMEVGDIRDDATSG